MQECSRHLAPDDKAGPRFPENRPGQPCSQQADQYPKEHFAAEERLVTLSPHSNAFSVSPVVNTKEYHDAFERMPLAKPVREGAYQQAGRILQAADGTDYEYMAAIDARDGRLVVDNLAREPSRKQTTFSAEEASIASNHRSALVIIHNHPSSSPPSFTDFVMASWNNQVFGSIVIGHDGSVWLISINDNKVFDLIMELRFKYRDAYGDFSEIKAVDDLINYNERRDLFIFRKER